MTSPAKPGAGDEIRAADRVRVAIRVRPFNKADKGDENVVINADSRAGTVSADRGTTTKSWTFDFVYGPDSQQENIFGDIGTAMLKDVLDGFHATCFAYGQTGSGKTHSMMGGGPGLEGLIPRLAVGLFEQLDERAKAVSSLGITVRMSFVEVYNEAIYDLLWQKDKSDKRDGAPMLSLRENAKTKAWVIEGLQSVVVAGPRDIAKRIAQGNKWRHKAETGMNDFSSRSHALVTLSITQRHDPPSAEYRDRHANLAVIDLAGSECLSKTGNEGERAAEAMHINKSLLTLCNCLRAASDPKSTHVPVRDSILTKMLGPVFGGNARTFMLACVSPVAFNLAETVSTLQMAYDSKRIKNKARANFDGDNLEREALMREHAQLLQRQIDQAEEHLTKVRATKAAIRAARKECDESKAAAEAAQQGGGGPAADTRLQAMQDEHAELLEAQGQLRRLVGEWRALVEQRRVRRARREAGEATGGGRSGLRSPVSPLGSPAAAGRLTDLSLGAPGASADSLSGMSPAGGSPGFQPFRPDQAMPSMRGPAGGGFMTARAGSNAAASPGGAPPMDPSLQPMVFGGSRTSLYSVSLAPNALRMVSGAADGSVRVMDLGHITKNVEAKEHEGGCLSVSASADGDSFATSGKDRFVSIFTGLASGAPRRQKRIKMKALVLAVAMHPGSRRFAAARSDGFVSMIDFSGPSRDARESEVLSVHEGVELNAVAWAPNGQSFATGSRDGQVRWCVPVSKSLHPFVGHRGHVWSLAFSPTGTALASGGDDGTLRLWDLRQRGAPPRAISGHAAAVMSVAWAKGGQLVLTASKDTFVKVWEERTERCLLTLVGHTAGVYSLSVRGPVIATASADRTIRVWRVSECDDGSANDSTSLPTSPMGQGSPQSGYNKSPGRPAAWSPLAMGSTQMGTLSGGVP
eukprot:TRINITY_DN3600_c0_g1_i1.p1 TRINITY_DN3600_c0_g1~~TRINITY_DN3600_c0_g1_i1.p1  ORF type:complete len:919 (+),score=183.83 TRINITY_DN3600_c0_g1_i1:326-3082(+)